MNKTKQIVINALMIALVFVGTFSIRIPIPLTEGYIHGGDSMIFLAAILFGWKTGAIAGGIGSALADLIGYPHWVIPTLIIKSIMGGLIGYLTHQEDQKKTTFIEAGAMIVFSILAFLSSRYVSNLSDLNAVLASTTDFNSVSELKSAIQLFMIELPRYYAIIVITLTASMLFMKLKFKAFFNFNKLISMVIAGCWMVFGYYIAASLMYGSFIIPLFSIPSNMLQFIMGMYIAFILLVLLERSHALKSLKLSNEHSS